MAIERRYHVWFDWRAHNANKFFRAFGSSFESFMKERVRLAYELDDSIRAFLEIGNLRNQMVHENFAVFYLDKTVPEIIDLYKKALGFVNAFPDDLRGYLRS